MHARRAVWGVVYSIAHNEFQRLMDILPLFDVVEHGRLGSGESCCSGRGYGGGRSGNAGGVSDSGPPISEPELSHMTS